MEWESNWYFRRVIEPPWENKKNGAEEWLDKNCSDRWVYVDVTDWDDVTDMLCAILGVRNELVGDEVLYFYMVNASGGYLWPGKK